jgi:folate-dependent phosphoribosylglycinamide formyltransferase PurN
MAEDHNCFGKNKKNQMKIVLWIGNESNQKALANKIHELFPLAGIVTETRKTRTKITIAKIIEKLFDLLFLSSIPAAWLGMKKFYEKKYNGYPDVNNLDVENINSDAVCTFTEQLNPDIIVVSGTRLIKERLLSLTPGIGIINLHTGLSPYIKGAPNCTNWCIATNQFHLIGNTIMWIDKGIDSGNIITTELTGFDGNETLLEVHIKVMEHAHALYLKAINKLAKGYRSNIKQESIAKGKTYYNKQWNTKQKFALKQNFKKFSKKINSPEVNKLKQEVKTVEI